MADLVRWTPGGLINPEVFGRFEDVGDFRREINRMNRNMNRMFRRFLRRTPSPAFMEGAWSPAIDLEEDADKYIVKAELPGINKEDIKVSVTDNTLTLSGERRFEREGREKAYRHYERAYGKFQRAFTLPSQVNSEQIKASYNAGILEIDIPKSETGKAREIEIQIKGGNVCLT